MIGNLRAFEIRWGGIIAYYAATSAGRARMQAARAIEDNFGGTVGEALLKMQCRRAPWMDLDALTLGRESHIPRCL